MKKIFRKLPLALAMLLVAACNDGIKSYDGLYIVGTQGKEVTTTLTVDDVPSAIAVNVAASELAKENINVELEAAPELVESFNKEHHKNYVLLPQDAYKLENTTQTIMGGKHVSDKGTQLTIVNLEAMRPGSALVDIAIDQGGCFEDSRPTTHSEPTFEVDGRIFYCVANMPGAVPHTSTYALTNATLPYTLALADEGWRGAVAARRDLARGLSTHAGTLYTAGVGEALDIPTADVVDLLS